MNRKQRRALQKQQHKHVAQQHYPATLTPVPREQWPTVEPMPSAVWISAKYMVQLYDEPHGVRRLSICTTRIGIDGRWVDGLRWDELQQIKQECGFGETYAVEVYPRDRDVVNDANMRHLWLLPVPLRVGWVR